MFCAWICHFPPEIGIIICLFTLLLCYCMYCQCSVPGDATSHLPLESLSVCAWRYQFSSAIGIIVHVCLEIPVLFCHWNHCLCVPGDTSSLLPLESLSVCAWRYRFFFAIGIIVYLCLGITVILCCCSYWWFDLPGVAIVKVLCLKMVFSCADAVIVKVLCLKMVLLLCCWSCCQCFVPGNGPSLVLLYLLLMFYAWRLYSSCVVAVIVNVLCLDAIKIFQWWCGSDCQFLWRGTSCKGALCNS